MGEARGGGVHADAVHLCMEYHDKEPAARE